MVVKEIRGRRRYVAFTLDRTLSKKGLESMITANGYGTQFRVIQCVDGWCIIRCTPLAIERAKHIISLIDPKSESLSTSGNLITLRHRYPALNKTRSRYIAFTNDPKLKETSLSKSIEGLPNTQHISVKFCNAGYTIVRCPLKYVDDTISLMTEIDPDAKPFLSSYKANDLRRSIANREPKLRTELLARK